MRLAAGLLAARATGAVTRLAGRGGTSLPGKVLMRAEPHAIARLSARLPRGSVVISATNGKTTTAAMVASILGRTGTRLVHNRAGANMAGGVAAALAAAARDPGDMGLFEVDEFWLGPVAAELEPRAVLLGNLFRDQLDRYGELEIIADRWAGIVAGLPAETALVLNADDPLVADLGRAPRGALLRRERRRAGAARAPARLGLQALPRLRARLRLRGRVPGPSRPLRVPELRRPPAAARDLGLGGRAARHPLGRLHAHGARTGSGGSSCPLPGLYNVYNALGAAALCLRLGVSLDDVAAGLAAVAPAFGRAETLAAPAAGRPRSC